MLYKNLLLALTFLLLVGNIYSQDTKLKWGLFGAVSLPVGDFGDDTQWDWEEGGDGFATTGFGAGLELIYPLGTPGLGWHTTAAFLYQGFDDTKLKELAEQELGDGADVDAGSYYIIPLLTGLSYDAKLSPTVGVLLVGQIGLGLIQKTTMEAKSSETDDTYEANFDMATSFGFGIGAGLVFNDKFNISFRYLGFGEPKVEMEAIEGDNDPEPFELEIPVSTILITAGIYF